VLVLHFSSGSDMNECSLSERREIINTQLSSEMYITHIKSVVHL
jgi:hypothetical protein